MFGLNNKKKPFTHFPGLFLLVKGYGLLMICIQIVREMDSVSGSDVSVIKAVNKELK